MHARGEPSALALMPAAKRHERDDLAAENVRARNRWGAVHVNLLDHLEDVLGARRTDRNDHDSAWLQLLEQGRGDVVDATGDDDLVERRRLRPARSEEHTSEL